MKYLYTLIGFLISYPISSFILKKYIYKSTSTKISYCKKMLTVSVSFIIFLSIIYMLSYLQIPATLEYILSGFLIGLLSSISSVVK